MSRISRFILAAGAAASVLLTSGCVTVQEPVPAQTTVDNTTVKPPSDLVSEEFFRIGQLPPQTLSEGDCGLFLFSGRPSPRFVFFGEAASGLGKMIINGEEVQFVRTSGEGAVFQLHFADQVYKSPARGLEVVISVVPEDETNRPEGQRISSGTLKMTADTGWSMVMPVGGAATCESE